MANDIPLVVRVAANLDELRKNLAEGTGDIETTSNAMRRMSTAYDGSRAISEAGAVVAAINNIGGSTKLTADEQAKANAILEAAIAKYKVLGQEVPPGMQAIADATKHTADSWGDFVQHFNVKDAIENPLGTAKDAMMALGESLGPVGVAAIGVVSALAAVATVSYELTKKAVEVGESIENASLKMGMSVEATSQMRFAIIAAGGSLEQFSNLVFSMQQRLETQPTAFTQGLKDLKINAQEFFALSPDERILRISSAMRDAGVEVNKQAVAYELLGRQGRDGLALLMKPLEELQQKSKELGFTWSGEDAKAADELAIKSRIVGLEWEKLWTDLGQHLIPMADSLVEHLNHLIDSFHNTAERTSILHQVLGLGKAAWTDWHGAVDLPKVKELAPAINAVGIAVASASGETKEWWASMNATVTQLEDSYTILKHQQEDIAETTKLSAKVQDDYTNTLNVLAKSYRDLDADMEKYNSIVLQHLRTSGPIQDALAKTNTAMMDELKAQQQLNASMGLELSGAVKVGVTALDTYLLKLTELHKAKVDGFSQSAQEQLLLNDYNKATEKEAIDLEAVATATTKTTAASVEATKAVAALTFQMQSFNVSAEQAARNEQAISDAFAKAGVWQNNYLLSGIAPARASGGPVSAGHAYTVGERGPELFVPSASGSIIPNGGGGGLSIAVHVTQPLGTPSAIANVVGDALVTKLRSLGWRPPA